MGDRRIHTAGLSQRKAASGELVAQMRAEAPYDELVEKLTAVRSLRRWTVEIFACFALKWISLGDLGMQRGWRRS